MIDLTRRQLDVLHGLDAGKREAEIAADLRLACSTVKAHRTSLYSALGARTAAHAVALAYRQGILTGAVVCPVCREPAPVLIRHHDVREGRICPGTGTTP